MAKAGGYISELTFNNGKVISVNANDIVVFVGPNNVGKSQALKDIYELSANKVPRVVVTGIKINKSEQSISRFLENTFSCTDYGTYKQVNMLYETVRLLPNSDNQYLQAPFHDNYRNVLVANLDTAARLSICMPPDVVNRNDALQHPIHYAAFKPKYRKWLTANFKKAFTIIIFNCHFCYRMVDKPANRIKC